MGFLDNLPVESISGLRSMHFRPGTVSSGLTGLMGFKERMSPLFSSSTLTRERFLSSKIVAAESSTVFLKKDLSKVLIERWVGGRKVSGTPSELRRILANDLNQVAKLLALRAMQELGRVVFFGSFWIIAVLDRSISSSSLEFDSPVLSCSARAAAI